MNQAIHRAMGRGAAFAAALLLAALPAQAITFGELDGNRHPYVGTLLFVQDGEGYYSCTGTLISPTVMLTAGHCVEGNGKPNDVTYVRFDAEPGGTRITYGLRHGDARDSAERELGDVQRLIEAFSERVSDRLRAPSPTAAHPG